jgi:hypothetical protein
VLYKEKCCPDFVPIFSGKSANSLALRELADFSGEDEIRPPLSIIF